MKTKYKASGFVYGVYWGGGEGSYPSIELLADTEYEIDCKIKECLSNGSLDSGMGYEKVIGALMQIEVIETLTHDNKDFTYSETSPVLYGDLSEPQQNFLLEMH